MGSPEDLSKIREDLAAIKADVRVVSHDVKSLADTVGAQSLATVPRGELDVIHKVYEYRLAKLESSRDRGLIWVITTLVSILALIGQTIWAKLFH